MLTGGGWVIFDRFTDRRNERGCRENLEALYQAIIRIEQDAGSLPLIALYPDSVQDDRNSLLAHLSQHGITPERCICRATSGTLQNTGITYIWNSQLNQKRLANVEPPRWMITEINALDPRVPAPHGLSYLVLYTNGRIEKTIIPPVAL